MGEAKRRGTLEERKAQAIAEGRVKKRKPIKRKVRRWALWERIKLFVWEGFCPDYTSGLAFAIAHTTEEAMAKVIESIGYEVYDWGTLSIHPLNKMFAKCVSGGG